MSDITGDTIVGNNFFQDSGLITTYNDLMVWDSVSQWKQVCEIDMDSAEDWKSVGIYIDAINYATSSRNGMAFMYATLSKTAGSGVTYIENVSVWGPKGNIDLKLRDMGCNKYEIWAYDLSYDGLMISVKYRENSVSKVVDFSNFNTEASGGASYVSNNIDYDFDGDVVINGDLTVIGTIYEG